MSTTRLPRRIGAYSISGLLAESGLSRVYQAVPDGADRPVALKTYTALRMADDATRERFRREVLLASEIRHPNVCECRDWGFWDTTPYLVMELLKGSTLEAHLAGGPLPVDRAVPLLMQALAGLEAIHEAGIVHRDIQPSNLFLTTSGVLRILDFGLARKYGFKALTPSGTSLGAAPYLAPEQLFNARHVDARADLFSLGVVAYRMLSNQVPFKAPDPTEVLNRLATGHADPLHRVCPDVPPALEALVHRLLQPDPDKRFGSASEARAALP